MTASRDYVCVRPQTYEDAGEAELLLSLFPGRSGALENTVFCVLAPDGERRLTRAGRSPRRQFDDPGAFARFLERTFSGYAERAQPLQRLPLHDNLALALNVASCDQLPLVILEAWDAESLAKLEARVAQVAWSEAHRGRQHFVILQPEPAEGDDAGAPAIELELEPGVTVVQAGPYGLTAEVLAHCPEDAEVEALAAALRAAYAAHAPAEKSRRDHVRGAERAGITWESKLPATDSDR